MTPMLSRRLALPFPSPSLRIDGVAHELSALSVLNHMERMPGGLPWSLDFDEAAASRVFGVWPKLKPGQPSPALERELFAVLRQLLQFDGCPRFCVARIDSILIIQKRVRLAGRCTPLVLDVLDLGGLTRHLT